MITVTHNFPEWQRTFRRYLAATSKTLEGAIYHRAYRVLLHAIRLTRRANRQEIESLGVVGYKIRKSRKTGQYSRGKAIYSDNYLSRARAILVGKYRKQGRPIPSSDQLNAEAAQLVPSRLRSIGYIASGWLNPFRKLGRLSHQANRADVRQFGKAKGSLQITKSAWNPEVIAANEVAALVKQNVQNIGEEGLRRAMAEDAADIERHLANKMLETARKHGIKAN